MSFNAGSVEVGIRVDSKQFDEAIEKTIAKAKELQSTFNSVTCKTMTSEIETLKKKFQSLSKINDDYRNKLNKLRTALNKGIGAKKVVKEIDQMDNALKKTGKSFKPSFNYSQYVSSAQQINKELQNQIRQLELSKMSWTNYGNTIKQSNGLLRGLSFQKAINELNQLAVAAEKYNRITKYNSNGANLSKFNYSQYVSQSSAISSQVNAIVQQMNTVTQKSNLFNQIWNKVSATFSRSNEEIKSAVNQYMQLSNAMERIQQKVELLHTGFNKITNSVVKTTDVLKTFNFALLEGVEKETIFYERTMQLASAMHKLNAGQGKAWKGRSDFGYSQYISQSKNIADSIKKINNSAKGLNSTNKTINQTGKEMSFVTKNTTQMGNAMSRTANQSRVLSSTLYKMRGALLSLKMIFSAMGGMALWGFAMDIAEGVKSTITAKNEMMAQLNANSKIDAGGIKYFTKGLDDLAKSYKKVNKYMVGETASSIGLEFELSAKQMKEALPIITMVQSEYVRAGRKEEEAALAMKDILQGEFQRLSRETGVGKEELLTYGWSGDKTDIDSLLKALEKAAYDRHWDLFAKKATSLNDVMTIMKSRFSETGADILESVTPMIVEGFNMIIGAIDKIQSAFNGLSPVLQQSVLIGGGGALIGGLLTAFPMITKGMGLADIATIGWGKSILTATLNLDKNIVAQHGFRAALTASITGLNGATAAEVGLRRAITSRLLGVNAEVNATHGLLGSMVHKKSLLKGEQALLLSTNAMQMSRAQKLAYVTTNMDLNTVAGLSNRKAIMKIATSWKVLRTVIMGTVAIGTIAWFASISAQCEIIKDKVDTFNEVVSAGDEMVKDAQKSVEDYTKALDGLTKGTEEYKKASNNLKMAKANKQDIETANKLAKAYEKQNKQREESIKLNTQSLWKQNYQTAGVDPTKASEKATGYTEKVKQAQEAITNSYDKQEQWLTQSSAHIDNQVKSMKAANVEQEKMNKYISEYSMVAEEAGEHLKQFYQGEFDALAYFVWDNLKLIWIDLWNNPSFLYFWGGVKSLWTSLSPIVTELGNKLGYLVNKLLELAGAVLRNPLGQFAVTALAMGGAITLAISKLSKFGGSVKSTIDSLKNLGKSIRARIKDWRKLGDETEKAKQKQLPPTTTTDPIPPTTVPGTVEKGKWRETIAQDLRDSSRKFVKYASYIAYGMGLVAVGIAMMTAPMLSLAAVGVVFKGIEPQIRAGIDGLKLIAPVVITFLVPVVALVAVINRVNGGAFTVNMNLAVKQAAMAIAYGMLLVTEAITLLIAPMLSLALVGVAFRATESQIRSGIEGLKLIAPVVTAVLIPVVALVTIINYVNGGFFSANLGLAVKQAAISIAYGMGLVTEAIGLLVLPMLAIAALGWVNNALGNGVQEGINAIDLMGKAVHSLVPVIPVFVVAIGAGAVVMATGGIGALYMAGALAVGMGLVAGAVVSLAVPLYAIAGLGSLFSDLSGVQQGAEAIKLAAEALTYVTNALVQLNAVQFLLLTSVVQQLVGKVLNVDLSALTGEGGIFDQVNDFITSFNGLTIQSINTEKVQALSSSATGITSVANALSTVQSAMNSLQKLQPQNMTPNEKYQVAVSNGNVQVAANGEQTTTSQFDQLLKPVQELSSFVTKFNNLPIAAINSEKVAAITSAGSMISSIKTAIDNVKSAVGASVDAQWNANMVSGGLIGAAAGYLLGNAGASSGLSSGLNELYNAVKDIMDFNTRIGALTGGGASGENIAQASGLVSALQTQINQVKTTLSGAVPTFRNAAANMGRAVVSGFKSGMTSFASTVSSLLSANNSKFTTAGNTYGTNLSNGFKSHAKIKDAATGEVSATLTALDGKTTDFYNKGYALGDAFQRGYKDGGGIHSPGYAAQAMANEIGYMGQYIQNGLMTLPYQAYTLGSTVSSQFTNSFNGTSLQLPNLTLFQQGISQLPPTVNNVQTQVGASFNGMQSDVANSFNSIVGSTSTSLATMQTDTTTHIGSIITSWRGMQNALIASAEYIRSKTSQKINNLRTNMGQFWKKIQNPNTLLRAGGHTGARPRRYASKSKLKGVFAGGTKTSSSSSKKVKLPNISSDIGEYIKCLLSTGKPCYAGGWRFDWTNSIQNKVHSWKTHFGKYKIDDYVNVGKFKNSTFPVKGIAEIAKAYIFDTISGTDYAKYFNSRYGDDPVAALNAGSFNCWDGTNIVLALANAFGFSGSREHGTWNGIGHVWANIPGLGIIDPTAIQQNGSFKSSSVRGYSAGGGRSRNSSAKGDVPFGDTYNTNVEIHVHGDDVTVDDRKIDDKTGKQLLSILGVNPATGR